MAECQWVENVDDASADYLCVTHSCFAVGMPSDDEPCRVAAAEAQLAAVRAVLHRPEHLWSCPCCQSVLDALGDDA